ncbi:MAG: electron transfer flavoprotein subunit alpha/FixB family protein, partial [Thermoguttaceae bacterium]|nr:electron transfer flavoprotein subunit alpha/FixB family protein [Thermoguttaceae bacterium]
MKVAFFAETADGKINRSVYELLAWSRRLAVPEEIAAVVITPSVDEAEPRRLASSGARHVFLCEAPSIDRADIPVCAAILRSFCAAYRPDVLLGAASVFGRALFPYAAMQMKTGLTADCTMLETDPETGLLLQTRPAIGGNVMAVIKTPDRKPQMATVRPRSAPEPTPYTGAAGTITRLPLPETPHAFGAPRTVSSARLALGEELADARRIVAVGKGIKREGNIDLAR